MTGSPESTSHFLADHPGLQRVPSPRIAMYVLRNFIAPQTCQALIDRIETQHRPSTITGETADTAFRTSSTCDLSLRDPLVASVQQDLSALCNLPLNHADPLQGQRYTVEQEFKAHTDYFEPDKPEWDTYCAVAGQRTWTAMVYLNTVELGGTTRFKAINKIIQPERGKLVAWNNCHADGTPTPATLHHAMKVRKGQKYVITQWFREKPWS